MTNYIKIYKPVSMHRPSSIVQHKFHSNVKIILIFFLYFNKYKLLCIHTLQIIYIFLV